MLNFNSLLIFSEDPKALGEFYQKVLGKDPDMEGDEWIGFKIGDGFISIGPHSKVTGKNAQPERIMFNLETDEVDEEFKRMKEAGAEVVAEPYSMGDKTKARIATLADPDGNYFQLMSPWEDYSVN